MAANSCSKSVTIDYKCIGNGCPPAVTVTQLPSTGFNDMGAIDILGDLLGHKTGQSGAGTDILKDIFKRKQSPSSGGRSSSRSTHTPTSSAAIEQQAEELEELLNVASHQSARHPSPPSQNQTSRTRPRSPEADRTPQLEHDRPTTRTINAADEERAAILVKAMINAAKSDGKLDRSEQQQIIERLGDSSRQSIDFLRQELSRPLDVEQFAREIPFGMEQQVYAMSLIAIDLDQNSEAGYLAKLADLLRIPVDVRRQLHQKYGAPDIYRESP